MSVRAQAAAGAKWLTLAMVLVTALSFSQNIILSQLLERADLGLVGMLWGVLGLAQAFGDMGLSQAIVQRQDLKVAQWSTIYWLNAAMGLLLMSLVWWSEPLLVWFYREPALAQLVPPVAGCFLLTALGQPFEAISQKNLAFHRLAIAEVTAAICGVAVAVTLASRSFGALSLVLGSLTMAGVKSVLLAAQTWTFWRPALRFQREDLRGILHFSTFQTASRLVNYFWGNVDYVLTGRFLGADAVGIYRQAYETAIRPLNTINPIFNAVALPIFARHQQDNALLQRGFLDGLRLIAAIVFPLLSGLAMTAHHVVPLAFGIKWMPVVPVLQVLCLLGALRCLLNLSGSLLVALGRVEVGFRLNLMLAVLSTLVYLVVIRYGLLPLAWSATAVVLAVGIGTWRMCLGNIIGLSPRDYLAALLRPAVAAAGMCAAVWLADQAGVHLALLVPLGGVIYTALLWWLDPALFGMLRTVAGTRA